VWVALVTIYLIWGSTYLAIRVVVESMPPLLAAAARFLPAALLAFLFVAARTGISSLRVTRREAAGAGFVGACLLMFGNGLVSLGEQGVPSGLTALLLASIPMWVLVMRVATGERPSRTGLLGVGLGLTGVALLVLPQGISGTATFGGMALILISAISWALGSTTARRIPLPADPYLSTGYQMLLGGLLLGSVGLLLGEGSQLQPAAWDPRSYLALGYLVVFGSVIAYPAYTWLLQNAPIGKVSTYAYVNPVVAVALGAVLLQERVDPSMIAGAVVVLGAVVIIVAGESRSAPAVPPVAADPAATPVPVAVAGVVTDRTAAR